MKAYWLIQKKGGVVGLCLASERDVYGDAYSAESVVAFEARESCDRAINRLTECAPDGAPYKAIRMHFADES